MACAVRAGPVRPWRPGRPHRPPSLTLVRQSLLSRPTSIITQPCTQYFNQITLVVWVLMQDYFKMDVLSFYYYHCDHHPTQTVSPNLSESSFHSFTACATLFFMLMHIICSPFALSFGFGVGCGWWEGWGWAGGPADQQPGQEDNRTAKDGQTNPRPRRPRYPHR